MVYLLCPFLYNPSLFLCLKWVFKEEIWVLCFYLLWKYLLIIYLDYFYLSNDWRRWLAVYHVYNCFLLVGIFSISFCFFSFFFILFLLFFGLPHFLHSLIFFLRCWEGTQSFVYARQALHHWAHLLSPILWFLTRCRMCLHFTFL
jgi:hypothetical protein